MRERLGECLVQAGLIRDDDLRRALDERKRTGERLGAVLVRLRLASDEEIAHALARQLGFVYVDLARETPDPVAAALIPRDVAVKHECIGVWREGDMLTVAMADPLRFSLVHDLESTTGHRINQVVATASAIRAAVATCYSEAGSVRQAEAPSPQQPDDIADPAVLVDRLLHRALIDNASDVYIEPREDGLAFRYRIDGAFRDGITLPGTAHDAVIAQLKTMAGMEPADTRLPQDGRLRIGADRPVDFRVSTIRTLFGERAVLRRLTPRPLGTSLEELGMSSIALESLRGSVWLQRGLVVLCGPRRSGKSTTAAAALKEICADGRSVVTVEDPVEFVVPGAHQIAVDERAGATLPSSLHSACDQDADVLFIGELRDRAVAAIALEAAGSRLVLVTIAREGRQEAIDWLTDAGMESPRTVVATVAQRLVRRLCDRCRDPRPADDAIRRNLGALDVDAFTVYRAVGCEACDHTGYRGRIGVFEVMRGASIPSTMPTLAEDALAKVKAGDTSPEEVLRVVAHLQDARTLCSSCGTPIAGDYVACPGCGTRLGVPCPHCGRALQAGWSFCPFCARATSGTQDNKEAGRNPIRGFNV